MEVVVAQYINISKVYFQGQVGLSTCVGSCMSISCVNKYKGSRKKENKKNSIVNRLLLSLSKERKGFYARLYISGASPEHLQIQILNLDFTLYCNFLNKGTFWFQSSAK